MFLGVPVRNGKEIQTNRNKFSGFINILYGTGVLDIMARSNSRILTALSYHRIDDPFRMGFDTYKPNVSATPADFMKQMDYIKSYYNAITCEHLALWLRGEKDLPPRAVVITFDDGYYDNLAYAFPILKDRNLPATIFLSTDFIGGSDPFYWDYVAYCFSHTQKNSSDLPLIGYSTWSNEVERDLVMRRWFKRVKEISESQWLETSHKLADSLEVRVPDGKFSGLYLSWDDVRDLSRNGVEMGAHTAGHPILTTIPLERAKEEILKSKKRIEAEIGKTVISFAYPNGRSSDFSPEIMKELHKAGIEVAFTLMPGPTRYNTVKRAPLAIRRIFVGNADTFPRFVAKLAGFARWI